MQLRNLLPLVALLPLLVLPTARGADNSVPSRLAVIDVQRVLAESRAGQAAGAKLQKAQEERAAAAGKMEQEVHQLEVMLVTQRVSLSETKLADLNRQITDKRAAMQRHAENASRELAEIRDRELQALEARIKPVIEAVAAEMNLAAVFNRFESGLLYASDRIDITDDVLRRFDADKK